MGLSSIYSLIPRVIIKQLLYTTILSIRLNRLMLINKQNGIPILCLGGGDFKFLTNLYKKIPLSYPSLFTKIHSHCI